MKRFRRRANGLELTPPPSFPTLRALVERVPWWLARPHDAPPTHPSIRCTCFYGEVPLGHPLRMHGEILIANVHIHVHAHASSCMHTYVCLCRCTCIYRERARDITIYK